jgi:hypothetical protein
VSYPPPPQGPPPPPGGHPPQGQPSQYPPYGYGGYPPQQPYWAPPPRIDPKDLKPSRLWYWLSPIPMLIGTAIAIVLLVGLIGQFDTDLDHFVTPGHVAMTLDKGDERGIYLQTAGTAGARSGSGATLSCSARNVATERTLPLKDASALTLTLGDDEYVEQWRFVAPADGNYVVSCQEPSGVPAAVGPHIAVRRFLGPVLGMIVAFLVGLAATAVIAIVTGVKRSNHKQRLQREARQAQGR